MDKRLLDRDPITGIEEWFHYDHTTDTTYVETKQDVEPILDGNTGRANDEQYSRDGIKNEMWHYASVPLVVQMKWLNEYGMDNWPLRPGNEKLLFRLLNSPEWRYLKATGKIHTGRS
jgi:hypothetical protein